MKCQFSIAACTYIYTNWCDQDSTYTVYIYIYIYRYATIEVVASDI